MNDELKKDLDASDPRPDGKPLYIDANCETCSTALVLHDDWEMQRDYARSIGDPDAEDIEPWHDEWMCPLCLDGIRMDWPRARIDSLAGSAHDARVDIELDKIDGGHRLILWDELKRELGIEDPSPEGAAADRAELDRRGKFYDEWMAKRGRMRKGTIE